MPPAASLMERPAVKRIPCDACHRRKVRCDYETPCKRCQDGGVTCTTVREQKKRGPKRQRTLSADDQLPTQDSPTAEAPKDDHVSPTVPSHQTETFNNLNGAYRPESAFAFDAEPTSQAWEGAHNLSLDDALLSFDAFTQNVLADDLFHYEGLDQHAASAALHTSAAPAPTTPFDANIFVSRPTPALTPLTEWGHQLQVTPVIETGVTLFMKHLHPIYPLFKRQHLDQVLQNSENASEVDKSLIWSICAFALMHVDGWPSLGSEERATFARRFLRQCLEVRVHRDVENACFHDILACLFIGMAYFELKARKSSWSWVRQAIAYAFAMGLHSDAAYSNLNEDEAVRYRRTYALLFITERGASILDGFPVTILVPPPLPCVPLADEDPTLAIGLSALHNLFGLLDLKFVRLWSDTNNIPFPENSLGDLTLLQEHLRSLELTPGLSEIQRADVLITQQWLRLVFWQLSLRQGFVSSSSVDAAFSYNYPFDIAMDLCEILKTLPPIAIEVHGLGIFEKQFEIAYSLMDALALSPSTKPEHHECLRFLLLSLSASPNSRQVYVRTLQRAIGGQQKYRSLAGVELLRDDSRQNSRRHSIAPGNSLSGK